MTDRNGERRTEYVVPGFEKAFDCWEAPFVDPTDEGIVALDNERFLEEYTVPITAGRIYLRKWLEPARKGSFPFLKLPAELRNTIYEMVLTFPATGFDIGDRVHTRHGVVLSQRETDKWPEPLAWSTHRVNDILHSAPMQKVLALLSVNKQLYNEAMPYFYQTNFFYFGNIEIFTKFMNRVPKARLHYLSDVYISMPYISLSLYHSVFDKIPIDDFQSAVTTLSQVKFLRKLEIETDDHTWFELPPRFRKLMGRTSKFMKPEQLPGIPALARAAGKAQALEVSGNCPRMEAYLRSEAEKLKSAGTTTLLKPKKRGRTRSTTAKCAEQVDGS